MARALRLPTGPAKLISSKDHLVPGQLRVTELFFQVPLDYNNPEGPSITLFARCATKHDVPVGGSREADQHGDRGHPKPYLVYLEGGPGFGNREPQDHPLTRTVLSRGYQLLLIDHRGTGLSTPVSADMLALLPGGADAQASYLKHMRQDNTVRDLEAVRMCLTKDFPAHRRQWSIFGQSYGGFVSMSYLSMHPEGLREVFLTGGLAPVGKSAEEVYEAVFPRIVRRNEQYYTKFPEDVGNVKQLAAFIDSHGHDGIPLPAGGKLTVPRLLTLGIGFGGHGDFDSVHAVILQLKASLDQFGFFNRASLAPLETFTPFDTNIIYAILHEAIYCDGPGSASNWASLRVGKNHPDFPWLQPDTSASSLTQPLYFTGENIFPFHFETYPELSQLRQVAQKLATFDAWPRLYDLKQLSQNEVPVHAASFVEDMYVDYNFARDTAKLVRGTKTFETNVLYHSALRARTEDVLQQLFSLRDDVID